MLSRRSLLAGSLATAGLAGAALARTNTPTLGKIKPANTLNIPHADLRPEIAKRGLIPRLQRASLCTSYASAFLIAYMQKLDNAPGVAPYASAEYVSWAALGGTKTANASSRFDQVVQGYYKWGAVAEADFPAEGEFTTARRPDPRVIDTGMSQWRLKADIFRANDGSYGLQPAHIAKIRDYLDKGIPIAAGLRLTESPSLVDYASVSAVLGLNAGLSSYGHSVGIVGYQDIPGDTEGGGGYFVAYNHGGPDWDNPGFKPQAGYFFLSYAFFAANTADLLAFTPLARGESVPAVPPMPHPATLLPDAPMSMIGRARK